VLLTLTQPSLLTTRLPIQVPVGATRMDLIISLVDPATGAGIDLRGGNARLQGRSPDLPALPLDAGMSLLDAQNGLVRLAGIGGLRSQTQLNDAGVRSAIYALRVRYEDAQGKADYPPEFELVFVANPLGV